MQKHWPDHDVGKKAKGAAPLRYYAGSPYGMEAMDVAVSAASEGRERRVHDLQELALKPHCRSGGAPRQHG
jgi:hypothetical protein